MKRFMVYKTTNLLNNKIYIGVHGFTDFNDGYLGSGLALLRAVKRHGESKFSREVLFVFDEELEAYKKEAELVTLAFVNKRSNYNLKVGGDMPGVSEETSLKMSTFRKNFEKTEDGKKARSVNVKARVVTLIATNIQTDERREFSSIKECAKELGLSAGTISLVCSGKQNRTQHKGWTFETVKYGKSKPISTQSHVKPAKKELQ